MLFIFEISTSRRMSSPPSLFDAQEDSFLNKDSSGDANVAVLQICSCQSLTIPVELCINCNEQCSKTHKYTSQLFIDHDFLPYRDFCPSCGLPENSLKNVLNNIQEYKGMGDFHMDYGCPIS